MNFDMRKRENINFSVNFSDFPDKIQKELIGIVGDVLDENDEVEFQATGLLTKYYPATFNSPQEGGDIEDIEIFWEDKRVTHIFENDEKMKKIVEIVEKAIIDDSGFCFVSKILDKLTKKLDKIK